MLECHADQPWSNNSIKISLIIWTTGSIETNPLFGSDAASSWKKNGRPSCWTSPCDMDVFHDPLQRLKSKYVQINFCQLVYYNATTSQVSCCTLPLSCERPRDPNSDIWSPRTHAVLRSTGNHKASKAIECICCKGFVVFLQGSELKKPCRSAPPTTLHYVSS